MVLRHPITEKLAENNYKSLRLILLALIYAVPILFGFYYISHYAVNVPYWDQWDTIVPWTIEWYEGTFDYNSIFEPQNDSRPIITNILMLFVSVTTALNVKAIFFVGYILFIICILFIFHFVKRDIGIDALTLILLIPVVFYALNPYYLYRFIANLGALNYPILILTALASLHLLYESKKSNLCFLCAIGTGVACTLSFAAGLTIWFAGFVQLLLQKMHRKWEKIIVWTISAVSVFYVYFVLLGFRSEGLHGTGAYASFIETTLQYPLNKFLCFMGTLGAEIVHDRQVALFFGLVILAITIALLYTNRESLQLDRYSKWYGLLAFGILTSLEVTLTRSGALDYIGTPETIFFIPGINHSLVIFLPILCIYILAIAYLKESISRERTADKNSHGFNFYMQTREHKNLFLLGVIFTLLMCSVVLHGVPGIIRGEANYDQQMANQYYLQNYVDVPDEKMKTLHPIPDRVKSQAVKLEQYNLSIFSNLDPEPCDPQPILIQDQHNQPIGEIYGERTVGQSFIATGDKLSRVDVKLATYARRNTENVIFQLREAGSTEDIVSITVNAVQIEDNAYHLFEFDPIPDSKGKTYVFTISSLKSKPGNAITIWYSTEDVYCNGTVQISDKPIEGDLSFRTYHAF